MVDRVKTNNPELEALFDRYQASPNGHVFAPLADALRKAGMIAEAIDICAKGVGLHPGYASGHVVHGKCFFDSGQIDEADDAFEKVLELDPNNLVALKYLGMILAERGDEERARERFKHILALDPDNREIKGKLEDLAVDENRENDESSDVESDDVTDEEFEGQSISLGDNSIASDEIATMTLADIYSSQGYHDKALKIYRDVLKSNPDSEFVRERIRALDPDAEDIAPREEPKPREEPRLREGGTTPRETNANGLSPFDHESDDFDAINTAHLDPGDEVASAESDSSPGRRQVPPVPPPGQDAKSYEQFKRWLKHLS